jgi:hypothetical protein
LAKGFSSHSLRKSLFKAGLLAGFFVNPRPDNPVLLDFMFAQPAQASGPGRIFGRIFG